MKIDRISELVEDYFELSLKTRSRKKVYVYARFVYFKLCKLYANDKTYRQYHHANNATTKEVAYHIGYDHASAIHSVNSFDELYKQKCFSYYKEGFDLISERIERSIGIIKNKESDKNLGKTIEEIEQGYKYRLDSMLEEKNEVITKLREENAAFENSESMKGIFSLPEHEILEFYRLADNFYKRKMREMQFVS